jgi:hypothetical protein
MRRPVPDPRRDLPQAAPGLSTGPVSQPAASPDKKPSAFDRALSLHVLHNAAIDYAARRGQPGSAAYRAAWMTFRTHIQSIDDLERMRARSARRPANRGPRDAILH